jgi:sugar O-acyltransferase (sialic acid O-acetyltransferase NeuD family)
MEQTKLYLYGASGHSKVILDILESQNLIIDGYFDDNNSIDFYNGYKVEHNVTKLNNISSRFIVSIGNNTNRKIIVEKLQTKFINAIHLSAKLSPSIQIGEGSVIMANVSINSSSFLGKHTIVNTNASVDHDCLIEDYVHLSPNVALAGNVKVGEGTHIGIGSSVIQGITIGKWAIIGAGSVIIRDVPDYAVIVGNPGKVIKYNYEK